MAAALLVSAQDVVIYPHFVILIISPARAKEILLRVFMICWSIRQSRAASGSENLPVGFLLGALVFRKCVFLLSI